MRMTGFESRVLEGFHFMRMAAVGEGSVERRDTKKARRSKATGSKS